MTADHCSRHRCHTCHCTRSAYGDPLTGATVRVQTALPPVPVR